MHRLQSYGSYGACHSCGPFTTDETGKGHGSKMFQLNGEISYATAGRDACGLASALPGTGMTKFATPYITPCSHSKKNFGNASVLSGIRYNWRTEASRIPNGLIFRQLSQKAFNETHGVKNFDLGVRDPWNTSQGIEPVIVNPSKGWSSVLNLSSGGPAINGTSGAFNVNYTGIDQSVGCTSSKKEMQDVCESSSDSYGTYLPYGLEIDQFRRTPYRSVYTNPSQNPQAFSVHYNFPF